MSRKDGEVTEGEEGAKRSRPCSIIFVLADVSGECLCLGAVVVEKN